MTPAALQELPQLKFAGLSRLSRVEAVSALVAYITLTS